MPTILICGGRHYANRDLVRSTLDAILMPPGGSGDPATWFTSPDVLLVNGACPTGGADRLATDWAVANFCNYREYPVIAEVDGPWPRAGINRNLRMFLDSRPALVLGFPGDRGTSNMLGLALSASYRPHVVTVNELLPLLPIDIAICRSVMGVDG